VAAVAAGVTWLVLDTSRDGQTSPPGGTAGAAGSSPGPTAPQRPPACSTPDASWTQLDTVAGATVRMPNFGLEIEVLGAAARPAGSMWDLVIQTRGTNVGFDQAGMEEVPAYHNVSKYGSSTVVDGSRTGALSCFSIADGNEELLPGSSSLALVGFDIPHDPRTADIVLELHGSRAITVAAPQ
jgi:hypothetical protein